MPTARYSNTDGRLRGSAGVARRLRIWSQDPHCAMCGKLTTYGKGTENPFHIDHIVALDNGGVDEDENLQTLCASPCHENKTEIDMGFVPKTKFDENGRVKW